jgi:hypothetical protein
VLQCALTDAEIAVLRQKRRVLATHAAISDVAWTADDRAVSELMQVT